MTRFAIISAEVTSQLEERINAWMREHPYPEYTVGRWQMTTDANFLYMTIEYEVSGQSCSRHEEIDCALCARDPGAQYK